MTVGALLEQRAFVITKSGPLYPNMYAILVGPPGVGKTSSIKASRTMIRKIAGSDPGSLHLAPNNMTGASLAEALENAKRDIINYKGESYSFNSLLFMPDEFSDLMPEYNGPLMGKLTTFYDVDYYEETRAGGKIVREIMSAQVSMIAGTTTSHLVKVIPSHVWEQGFPSRTVLIFADKRELKGSMFNSKYEESPDLEHDIECLQQLQGQFKHTPEFVTISDTWRDNNCQPKPTYHLLKDYCERRFAHMLKLAMISSVDRGDDLMLEVHDFHRATKWLFEAEQRMPEIFGIRTSDASKIVDEALYRMDGKDMRASELNRLLQGHLKWHEIDPAIKSMVNSGQIIEKIGPRGVKYYRKASNSSADQS